MSVSNIKVPMERRIVTALQSGHRATKEEKELVQAYLREHFFREYYSPLPYQALSQHFQLREYAPGETIFQQGEQVTSYCFLLLGRVMVTRKEWMQEEERCLLDGPSPLGECVEVRQPKRESTARVVSMEAAVLTIPTHAIQSLLVKQIAEFEFILFQIAAFAGTTTEGLDRVRLAPLVRLQKYRLKETVKTRAEVGYLIVQGECRVSSRRREAVISRSNCLAIAGYFQKSEEECTYTAYSTELQLVAFSYSALPLLPPSFVENLSFLHQAHRLVLQEAPLPRLQRNTTNPSLHQKPAYCTHKSKKSSSMADLEDGFAGELQSLRRHFVLGFYSQQAAANAQDYRYRRSSKKPKGYFDLKVRAENVQGEQQVKRRQWASYLKARSQQKAKLKDIKGNLKPRKQNTPTLSPKQNNLADLFSRYHNLPSLPHKKQNQNLAKAGKMKQYVFKHSQ